MAVTEFTQHENISGNGNNYLQEGVHRALRTLIDPKESDWKARIINACGYAHRPDFGKYNLDLMSDATLEAFIGCCPSRFNERVDELTEEEVTSLSHNLMAYLHSCARDGGVRLTGEDPKEYCSMGKVISYHDDEERIDRSNIYERMANGEFKED